MLCSSCIQAAPACTPPPSWWCPGRCPPPPHGGPAAPAAASLPLLRPSWPSCLSCHCHCCRWAAAGLGRPRPGLLGLLLRPGRACWVLRGAGPCAWQGGWSNRGLQAGLVWCQRHAEALQHCCPRSSTHGLWRWPSPALSLVIMLQTSGGNYCGNRCTRAGDVGLLRLECCAGQLSQGAG